jgi:hypothetical protein
MLVLNIKKTAVNPAMNPTCITIHISPTIYDEYVLLKNQVMIIGNAAGLRK